MRSSKIINLVIPTEAEGSYVPLTLRPFDPSFIAGRTCVLGRWRELRGARQGRQAQDGGLRGVTPRMTGEG